MTAPSRVTLLNRNRAYTQLGINPQQINQVPQITPELRRIHRMIRGAGHTPAANIPGDPIYYLNTSEDPDARKVLNVYYSLPRALRRLLPIEAYCIAASVSPLRVLELITLACVRLGAQSSTIIAAINHPRVVEKTVEMALTDDGIADRNSLHKATGFHPTPKSAQTNISITQTAQAAAVAHALQNTAPPPPEQTIRRMVDRFNQVTGEQPAALPPTSAVPIDIPVEAREPVYAQIVSEGDEDDVFDA